MRKITLIVVTVGLLLSCGPQKMEIEESSPQTAKESQDISSAPPDAVEISNGTQGLVVFLTGDVTAQRDGEEVYLDIGDSVEQSDLISTLENGYCEIQLGETAVVRMEANSVLQIQTLFSADEGSRTAVDLQNGTVLCKVKKLLEEDSFQVKTSTVVCGVRGTQFSVSAGEQAQNTLLAVKEGAVAVTPRSLDQVSELAVNEKALAPIAAKIQETALVVGPSEELSVQKDTFKESEEMTKIVAAVVKKVEEKKKAASEAGSGDRATEKEAMDNIEKAMQQEVSKMLVSLEQAPQNIAPEALKVQNISEKSKEVLKKTDSMEIVGIPVAASVPGQDNSPAAPSLYKFQIDVTPSEALISGNGNLLGKGHYAKLYADGTVLKMKISLEGYKTKTLDVTVGKDNPGTFSVELDKIPEKKSEPVSEDVPEDVLASVPVVENPVSEPVLFPVSIQVQPSDASLVVNGEKSPNGEWSGSMEDGSVLKIEASRDGYEPVNRKVTVSATTGSVVIKLNPQPIEVTSSLDMGTPVGVLAGKGPMYLTADAAGKVVAFNAGGKVLWKHASANSPNSNSSPVEYKDRVYFSGGSELVILERNSGKVVNTVALEDARSHLYGRRVVPISDQLMLPTNDSLILIDADGQELKTLPIPGGSSMSPSLWSGKAVIADKKGDLLVINPANGAVLTSVSTSAVQSVAQSPAIFEDKAVFSSRKGVVAAVDLKSGTLLWERDLNRTVFSDVLVVKEGCFVYTTKKEVFALSWKTGEDLYGAIAETTSVPGYDRGKLVLTDKSGILKIVNAGNGSVVQKFNLKDSFTARPIFRNGIIVGVGKSGQFYRINPEGFTN